MEPPAAPSGLDILGDVYALERDPGVRALLRNAWTMGCFYIESPSMRALFEKLRCETFEAVVAASSVIRPGVAESGMMQEYVARATGQRPPAYLHPKMRDLLGDTFGVMVYQEDVLRVVHEIGGLTLGEADLLRRAISGKGRSRESLAELERKFFASARERGIEDATAREIWRQISTFAAYSFCKGHSAAFAVLSFQTLWLKAHWLAEFLAAVLANGGGYYSTSAYVQEARRLGVRVEGPCVNRSALDWRGRTNRTVVAAAAARENGEEPGELGEWWERLERARTPLKNLGRDVQATGNFPGSEGGFEALADPPTGWIRAGLLAVAGLSPELVVRILAERDSAGAYRTPEDFWTRARPTPDEAERLIRCGACDVFGRTRPELLMAHALWRRSQVWDSPLFPWGGGDILNPAPREHTRLRDEAREIAADPAAQEPRAAGSRV